MVRLNASLSLSNYTLLKMHRRSVSSDYHLDTQSLDHRGSFSSVSTQQQYYGTPSMLNQQQLPPPPPNTTQKPAHTNTFVHKLYK